MSEFEFILGGDYIHRVLPLRVGFSAEVEIVKGWDPRNDNFALQPAFLTIPSGPVRMSSVGLPFSAHTIFIGESTNPGALLEWLRQAGGDVLPVAGVKVRAIAVLAGIEYSAYHAISGPFVGMIGDYLNQFVVEAVGIPERAPASMVQDPNPNIIVWT